MDALDIIIIILAVATVVGVTAHSIWKKKNGKGGCGCGCAGCPSAKSCALKGNCSSAKEEKGKTEEKNV